VRSNGRIRPSDIQFRRDRADALPAHLRLVAQEYGEGHCRGPDGSMQSSREGVTGGTENIRVAGECDLVRAGGTGVRLPVVVIPFVKASACGNDFLLIDSLSIEDTAAAVDMAAITRRLCNRHEGVGADGVEWMSPHPSADLEIRLINADGSEAEVSGNGTRCVAAYVCAEQGKEKITVQTGAGLKTCMLTGRSESEYEFEVEMGSAVVEAELAVNPGAHEVRGIPVSMGNPHYVVFVTEFSEDWQTQAARIQRSPEFKHGVNVELVSVGGKHDVKARFFERGVGETQSSGTGSCASAVAAMVTGRAESPVRVHAPGGIQTVRREGNTVFLRGAARLVCRGEFYLS
jgi:diaminopimelate epimerase